MARIYAIRNPNPGKIQMFYVVDQAVGTGCANRREDVLLVQFFLKVVVDEDAKMPSPVLPPGVRKGLSIDGAWGRQSAAYLKHWEQHTLTQAPGVLTADGRVDPVQSGTTVGSLTRSIYKICILNGHYGLLRGLPAHANISNDVHFPQELTRALFVNIA